MNGRILLLLVSTATVAACARPTPPPPAADAQPTTAETTTTSHNAPTTTSVAKKTTETTVVRPTTHRHVTTTTKPPPPPPPKPPDRWALGADDRRRASDQTKVRFSLGTATFFWSSVCPGEKLCVNFAYVLGDGVTSPEEGCVEKIGIPNPLHEGGTVTYVLLETCSVTSTT